MSDNDTPQRTRHERIADLGALKALAHPVRIALYDLLSQYGPATASGLGERIGESSGSTSYHLRQLAAHDLIREVEGRGSARERWWERTPGGLSIVATETRSDPAAMEMTRTVVEHWNANRAELLDEFSRRGPVELDDAWFEASVISTLNFRLTAEQLDEFVAEWQDLADRLYERFHGSDLPGSRPVQVHFNAFPLMGGEAS
ncbi:helix-turn-helix domain-containing protein [Agromyces atrinae]|uniref:ArsR family transcriptional regulator n=1 Tax=Agromyces atrinae TaxID=592376 RepID=A0A4Q2M418_9MICO|nr:helix-turn-helix domain-containing protein [Agromyces atrinae]MCI2958566.1 helix-turn-helix domain-containing protein [Agromyces atrinae]NYD66213.1 DNA-binding transcriptional ArsR family regulator [Agromyces atrinae]RXZ86548.1 ArsR family transcriptional regulator [Agromyces atrinae]